MARTFETERNIRARGRLLLETEHGRDEYTRWRALGTLLKFSYKFDILDYEYGNVQGRRVRVLKRMKVHSSTRWTCPRA